MYSSRLPLVPETPKHQHAWITACPPLSNFDRSAPACLTDLKMGNLQCLNSDQPARWKVVSTQKPDCPFETYCVVFHAERKCPGAKFRLLAKCAGIPGVKHRMHLSERILGAPKKLWRLFEEASLFFFTDTSRSQKQCLCVVNKKTCRWQPLHVGYSECLVIQPAIKCALNPQNKEIFGSYHTWNAQKM